MKACPNDLDAFKQWLDAQGAQPVPAAQIFAKLREMELGVLGRTCCCGEPGTTVRTVQASPCWPRATYVFCADHAAVADQYHGLMDQIVREER